MTRSTTLLRASQLTEAVPDFSLIESLRWTPENGYWLLDYHLRRLRDSADYFDFVFDETCVLNTLEERATVLPKIGHKVRLLLARDGTVKCSAELLGTPREPVELVLANTPVTSSDKFLFHKTTNRAVYEAAMTARGNADDVLLWNERGEITEPCRANIIVQFGEELYTPARECGLLGGTFRAALLAEGKIRERVIMQDELKNARALFRINSVRGWQRARLKIED